MSFNETELIRVLSSADLREEMRDNTVSLRWATITGMNPLTVRRDGESESFEITGSAVDASLLEVDDRVRVSNFGSKAFIESSQNALTRDSARWGSRIPAGANLNDYTTPGQWYNPSTGEVAGFTNGPPSNAAGALVVLQSGTDAVIQFWHGFDDEGSGSKIYRRRLYSGSWSSWKISGGEEWPKPRRMGMSTSVSVPTSTDYRAGNWVGIANDPGNVAGGITYADGGFTVPQNGVYTISTVIRWLGIQNAVLMLFTGPSSNNTTQGESMVFSDHRDMHCTWTLYLVAGYRVEVRVRQTSGTTQSMGGSTTYNWCQIARVS